MSYPREIPRDLFNEANLLKCMGKLAINIDESPSLKDRNIVINYDGGSFDIRQAPSDGSLYVANMTLTINGHDVDLYRPLNSREAWPLYAVTNSNDGWTYAVFDDNGDPSADFVHLARTMNELPAEPANISEDSYRSNDFGM